MSGSGTSLVAGVDVGGTDIEVGLVDGDHEVRVRAEGPTPTGGPDAVLHALAEGGGLAEELGQDLADRVEGSASEWMPRPSPDLRFTVSQLEDDAGVVGAAALARAQLLPA